MSDRNGMKVPAFLIGGLIIISLIGAVVGTSRDPDESRMGDAEPVIVIPLRWEGDVVTGGRLIEEETGDVLAEFEEVGEGLVRNAIRSILSTRTMQRGDALAPFQLIRWDTGRITLSDTNLNKHIPLNSFGPPDTPALAAMFQAVLVDPSP